MIMNKLSEIEKILTSIDYSQERENVVWEKILARLPHGVDELSFNEFGNVSGGSSDTQDRCDNTEYLDK